MAHAWGEVTQRMMHSVTAHPLQALLMHAPDDEPCPQASCFRVSLSRVSCVLASRCPYEVSKRTSMMRCANDR